jgi:hypothetical protein
VGKDNTGGGGEGYCLRCFTEHGHRNHVVGAGEPYLLYYLKAVVPVNLYVFRYMGLQKAAGSHRVQSGEHASQEGAAVPFPLMGRVDSE